MATMFFGYPLQSDTATLSGGSWPTLGLANAQTDPIAEVARSGVASNVANTLINIDFGAAQAVSVIAVVAHNMRSAATWRVRGSASAAMTSPYDSGTIPVWPEQWPAGLLPTGHPNAATRLLTDTQIDNLNPKRNAVHVPATEQTYRYWRVEFFDTANADGYVELGRLILAPRYQPSYNYSIGSEEGFDDGTVVGRSQARTKFFGRRPRGRSMMLSFQNLPHEEARLVMRDMMEYLGIDKQVYLVADPAATYDMQRSAFLATLRALGSVQRSASLYATVPLTFDEVL